MWRSLVLGGLLLAACGGQVEGESESSQGYTSVHPLPPVLTLPMHNVWFDAGETGGTLQFDTDRAELLQMDVTQHGTSNTLHFGESGTASIHHAIAVSGLLPCVLYDYVVWNGLQLAGGTLMTRDAQIVDGSLYVWADLDYALVSFQTDIPTVSAGAEVDTATGAYVSSAIELGAANTYHQVRVNGLQQRTSYRALAYHTKSCGWTATSFATATQID
jgi:hypothetical protein